MKRLLAEACELVDSDESVPLAQLEEALDSTNHLVHNIHFSGGEREMVTSNDSDSASLREELEKSAVSLSSRDRARHHKLRDEAVESDLQWPNRLSSTVWTSLRTGRNSTFVWACLEC